MKKKWFIWALIGLAISFIIKKAKAKGCCCHGDEFCQTEEPESPQEEKE